LAAATQGEKLPPYSCYEPSEEDCTLTGRRIVQGRGKLTTGLIEYVEEVSEEELLRLIDVMLEQEAAMWDAAYAVLVRLRKVGLRSA
jgi:hypothetical protein